MDYLIDDRPFSGSGKTTFELIDHYLPILMGDLVNGRLKCSGKAVPKIHGDMINNVPLRTLNAYYEAKSNLSQCEFTGAGFFFVCISNQHRMQICRPPVPINSE